MSATASPRRAARACTGRWQHLLADGRLQCDLCPRACRLREGQRGFCFVRERRGDSIVSTTWGRSSGFCLDPIEKKPLHHFHPGTPVLSFGTAGCNLGCRFCQNWDISAAREWDRLGAAATPERIARTAQRWGVPQVAFTYNDPVVYAEYAIDTARACHDAGVRAVAVTAGYVAPAARADFFAPMDAANIDLKGFTEDFYWHTTGAHLADVLDTIAWVVAEGSTWVELTTLLIPERNDAERGIRRECRWIRRELGPDVPLHLSAFHPAFKMPDVPPTPPETLRRAREIALEEGLHFAYTGNIRDPAGETTSCPGCGAALIRRDWYRILDYRITPRGTCPQCGQGVPGRFDTQAGTFGARSVPVRV
jgi:pyruvate formate lyase activating enzyme